MDKSIRHTKGFSCAPGSGFIVNCPNTECRRLLLMGQRCVCGTNSAHPGSVQETLERLGAPRAVPAVQAFLDHHKERESAPRDTCPMCSFEYPKGNVHVCAA